MKLSEILKDGVEFNFSWGTWYTEECPYPKTYLLNKKFSKKTKDKLREAIVQVISELKSKVIIDSTTKLLQLFDASPEEAVFKVFALENSPSHTRRCADLSMHFYRILMNIPKKQYIHSISFIDWRKTYERK